MDKEIEQRVDDLLTRMTIEEKVGQMSMITANHRSHKELASRIQCGQIGSILNADGVKEINRLQKIAAEESRLRIPLIFGFDVIHGYRTIFPIPLAESCTWEPDLVEEASRIAAEEASADGIDWTFAPMVDICRDPRWGRIAEGAGEDPFLGAAMAAARVRGYQYGNLVSGRKMVSCPKHFAGYGAAEAGKDYNTVDISERTLRDVYLPPFKAAIDEGAGTLMTAFNEISGVPASANALILDTILRKQWKFNGVVLSDWNAVGELMPHGLAIDLKDACKHSALAGVDVDMMADAYHQHLADLVRQGVVPSERIDGAVGRVLRLKMILGLFDKPFTDETKWRETFLRSGFRKKALEMARKSMVLLKNDGLLPLDAEMKHIALIGPLADDHHEILGCCAGKGCDEDTESVLDGFQAVLPSSVKVTSIPGCDLRGVKEPNFEPAVSAAREAEVAVLVMGEGRNMSGEAHSRAYLGLPGHQQALLEHVHATGVPVVVVLMSGRPLVVSWMVEHVGAILQAWHGGIRTGRAVADILFGKFNPSGKLTASWPRTEGQIPVYYAHKNTGRPPGQGCDKNYAKPNLSVFIDEVNEPQFPFGHGMSYTTFDYSNLTVETPEIELDGALVVSVMVKNGGDISGDEIVQLYIRDLAGSVTRPVKELKGFQRISLKVGESKKVRFELPVQHFGFHGRNLDLIVEPGAFKVWVGPSAVKCLEGKFTILAQ
jgi:beta-glucosidase